MTMIYFPSQQNLPRLPQFLPSLPFHQTLQILSISSVHFPNPLLLIRSRNLLLVSLLILALELDLVQPPLHLTS